jgi:hypothetical protein
MQFLRRVATAACVALLAFGFMPSIASAQTSIVEGVVTGDDNAPVPGATVEISGQNLTLRATTDAHGHFAFTTLTVGRYRITVSKDDRRTQESFDLGVSGLALSIALPSLKTIGSVVVARNPQVTRSGTDISISGAQLEKLPTGGSLPQILVQLPSAAQGSNGQIHINGDHNGLSYYLDGVQMPTSLNRVLGNEIDPSTIGYLDVIEGAYPAQYGNSFAAILNVGTKSFAGPAGYTLNLTGGSYNTYETQLALHAPLGTRGGSVSLSTDLSQNSWGIDPPVPDPVHDASSAASEFLRISLPAAGLDTINLDALHSLQSFQIPPDTANGVPADTDDNEYQDDSFFSLQYRHAIGDRGVLQFGPSLKTSTILDTPDQANDLAAGGPPPAPGGYNCIDFTNCIFSLDGNRTAHDYRFNVDYSLSSPHHDVKWGVLYDSTIVVNDDAITLQPYSALDPAGSLTVYDNEPNVAHEQEAYLQDSWRMGDDYQFDYGLRMDAFQVFSTDFHDGYSQWSPRLKFTRLFGKHASVYAYYGRLFEPFSFESVNPEAAAALYYAPPANGAFDLKPERDSLYELGGHIALGSGDLGLRIMHKVATDWIDDTQIGATNLHQDINFPVGRVDAQVLSYQDPLPRDGKFYASLTHSIALNSLVCETNLLQNCTLGGYVTGKNGLPMPFYLNPGGGLVQADHDQHWDAVAGALLDDKHGGWVSFSGEYGSGLSQGDTAVYPGPPAYALAYDPACFNGDAVNCKVPPHLIFNAEKGVAFGKNMTAALGVTNLLNDRWAVTLDNSLQGTHYARPRTILLTFGIKK